MDRMHEIDRGDSDHDLYADDVGVEAPPAIGTDERRMHVRAYNYWVSLLDGRAYPSIEDLDPASIDDFGPNSVLLDFSGGIENPSIAWLGKALREECGFDQNAHSVAEVPSRSLLSRLTDHYLQIIANRAPIGFEAEFVGQRGVTTMYRGILMPFSSDEDTIDFIYGVINWKDLADIDLAAELVLEVDQAIRATPRPAQPVRAWADGPNAEPQAGFDAGEDEDEGEERPLDDDAELGDWLAAARATAETARRNDGRTRAALYKALGLAYDFALVADQRAEDYAELLQDAGLKAQARAPMTPIVKLVFGVAHDKTRLTEYAAALSHGRRNAVPVGQFRSYLEGFDGGLKGAVQAERRARAPIPAPDRTEEARTLLRAMPPQARTNSSCSSPAARSAARWPCLRRCSAIRRWSTAQCARPGDRAGFNRIRAFSALHPPTRVEQIICPAHIKAIEGLGKIELH